MTDQPVEPKPVERLCQVCRRVPVTVDGQGTDRTCATCLGHTRQHIKNLGIMATALLGEALLHRLDSESLALAGPVANPETWGYRRTAMLANRARTTWLDDEVDLLHPLWVLASWERQVRLQLGQVLSPGSAMPTLTEARTYLDTHLSRLAHTDGFPFDHLAEDIKVCHNHVERVLHLEEHVDRGAPCPACGKADLEKTYGTTERFDAWRCPRCHEAWSEIDYRLRVADDYLQHAKVLNAADIERAHRVPTSTLRTWVQRDQVKPIDRRDPSGRQLFRVADVLAIRDSEPTTATG